MNSFVLPSVYLARRAEKFVNKLHVDEVYLSLFFCEFFVYYVFEELKIYIMSKNR